MKLGVHALMLNGLTPERAVSMVSQSGYQGIEWGIRDDQQDPPARLKAAFRDNQCVQPPTAQFADSIHQLCRQQRLAIPSLYSHMRANDIANTQTALVFGQRIKAPCVRVNTGSWNENYESSFNAAKRYLTTVVALSRAYGVRCLVENMPGTLFASPSQLAKLVSHFDPQHIGVVLDVGNLVVEGHESYSLALDMLKPYLTIVHLKNAVFERGSGFEWKTYWATLKKGIADIPTFMRALQAIEYDGWLIVEDLSPQTTHLSLQNNYVYLQQLLK